MSLLNFLSANAYLIVNKYVVITLGLDEAILLGELIAEYEYWEKEGKIEDGFFFSTVDNVFSNTTLSEHRQRNALKTLEEYGLVSVERRGMPAKRYIRINEHQVTEFFKYKFLKNSRTSSLKIEEQVPQKLRSNNNKQKNNKLKIINKDIYVQEFEELWAKYPRKQGKVKALDSYIKARAEGVLKEEVEQGILDYLEYIKNQNVEGRYIKMGSTWFNQRCWTDDNSMRLKNETDLSWIDEVEL